MESGALAALKKKNNGTGKGFHLTGLKNVAELVECSEEEEISLAPAAPPKGLLGNLLGEARQGGEDIVSPEKKQENQKKREEYERVHARPATPRSGYNSKQNQLPNGFPSLQALQHAAYVLKDGTTFRGDSYRPHNTYHPDDAYRPHNTYRPESPCLSKGYSRLADAYHLDSPSKVRDHYNSCSCQVSLCDHEHFCIDWDPVDPDNRKGSWKARMKWYWDHDSSREDHKSCGQPNYLERSQKLAERIIQTFTDIENGKLTRRDRDDGKEPRRPPPANRVEREVQIMYSQLHRGKTDNLVEQREALRVKLDTAERCKKLAEKTQQQALLERQQGKQAKRPNIDDGEDDDEPVAKKPKKSTKVSEDGFRPTTADEETQQARLVKQVRHDRAVLEPRIAKKQKEAPVLKRTKTPQRPQKATVESESNGDTQDVPQRLAPKHSIRRQHVIEESADELKEHEVVEKPAQASQPSETPIKRTPIETSKPKPRELTAEERALLAGINQAEEEEIAQAETEEGASKQHESQEPAELEDEDEELRNELAAIERPKTLKVTNSPAPSPASKPNAEKLVNEEQLKEVEESWYFFEAAKAEKRERQPIDEEQRQTSSETLKTGEAIDRDIESVIGDTAQNTATAISSDQEQPGPKQKKRKASAVKDDDEEQPAKKKGRRESKSARVIQDSDEEADYELPDAASKLPEAAVREDWQAEGTALVEEAVHHQEELEEQREAAIEAGEVVVISETIETQDTPKTTDTTETVEITDITRIVEITETAEARSSLTKKRKYQTTMEDELETSSIDEESSSKKPKPSPIEQQIEEQVTRPRTPTSSSPQEIVSSPIQQVQESTPNHQTAEQTSTPPSSPSSTPSKKRKNLFSEASVEDEGFSPTSRPIKKAKKVSFLLDIMSPVEKPRKISVPYIVVTEADEEVGKDTTSSDCSEDPEIDEANDGFHELFEE